MTTTDLQVDDGIGAYLNRLETAPVAPAERDEIVVEIRAHIHDSVSGTSDPNGATEPVFRLLGTPEELVSTPLHYGKSTHPTLAAVSLLGSCCAPVGDGPRSGSRER